MQNYIVYTMTEDGRQDSSIKSYEEGGDLLKYLKKTYPDSLIESAEDQILGEFFPWSYSVSTPEYLANTEQSVRDWY